MWQVELYEKENGEKPVATFIKSLDLKLRLSTVALIDKLEILGNNITEPFSKHIKDGVFELRIKQSTNIARVFYFFQVGKKIILTNGFVKKTQKTPKTELTKALEYKKDYEQRSKV